MIGSRYLLDTNAIALSMALIYLSKKKPLSSNLQNLAIALSRRTKIFTVIAIAQGASGREAKQSQPLPLLYSALLHKALWAWLRLTQ